MGGINSEVSFVAKLVYNAQKKSVQALLTFDLSNAIAVDSALLDVEVKKGEQILELGF